MVEVMLEYWKDQYDEFVKRAGRLKELPPEVGVNLAPVAQVDAMLAVAAAIRVHALILEEAMQQIAYRLLEERRDTRDGS